MTSHLIADARWVEPEAVYAIGSRQYWRIVTTRKLAVETSAFLRRLGTAGDGVAFLDKLRLASFAHHMSAKRTSSISVCARPPSTHSVVNSTEHTGAQTVVYRVDASHVRHPRRSRFIDDLKRSRFHRVDTENVVTYQTPDCLLVAAQ